MLQIKLVQTEQEKELAFTVRKQVFVQEQGIPLHLEIDEHDATAKHFIVLDGTQIIAAARLREIEPKIGKVERVCVLSEHRGKHFGAYVMNALELYAIEQSWEKLKLHAQTYAIPFYEKLNYTVTSPEFIDADIPHRAMEKII